MHQTSGSRVPSRVSACRTQSGQNLARWNWDEPDSTQQRATNEVMLGVTVGRIENATTEKGSNETREGSRPEGLW